MSADALVEAALRGALTETQARRLCRQGREVVVLALLAASKRIAEQDAVIAGLQGQSRAQPPAPSTPSGMLPIYTKANTPRRRKKPGARKGHPGRRRQRPERIDKHETHRLKRCPCCGGTLQRCQRRRTRIIEDIPEEIRPVVTEHAIHRDYCPKCKKHVEPVVPDAMPGATLGHHVIALTSWFHYGLGITIDHIVEILGCHLQTKLTPGGLIDAWRRLAEVLERWYEQIGEQAKNSAHLHADETGWRVNGQTHWLWCFANGQVCYYMIDRCRGSPALQKFFIDEFEGVLITDFWAPYESVCAEDRQYCLVHLLRELEKVDLRNDSAEWRAFAKKLRLLLRDGIRLRKRADFAPGKFQSRVDRLNKRLIQLASEEQAGGEAANGASRKRSVQETGGPGKHGAPANSECADKDVRRLKKRLRKYAEYIFTFLDYEGVPFENNFAERQIRPAVILRKNSQSNRSQRGAATQAILMSVYRTLKLRNLNPTQTIANALKTYLTTGQLPPATRRQHCRRLKTYDNSTQRRVAIKVLRSGPFSGEAERGRFEREIQVLAQLQHPNIVTIHSSGTVALQRYFVMDFIDGQSLDEYISGNHHTIEQTLGLFLRICEAVNAAHLRGVVHRDLKPGNIRIDSHGEPHVLDFGLAKTIPNSVEALPDSLDATAAGQFVGSLPWAAPEQVMNTPEAVDLRTDVYGLGLLLYFMLTQSFPYDRRANLRDMTDNILQSEPAPPSSLRREIDNELDTIVLMCLQKEPERRYQMAGELARDIKRYRAGEPIEAKRDSAGYLLAKTIRRHRGLAALATAFLVVSLVYAVTMSFLYQRATESEQLAESRAADVGEQYAITRDAIGFLVEEVSSKLNQTPGNTRLRRDILEGAFERLAPLVEKHGDDPLLHEDLMRAHYQLGDIAIALTRYDTAATHLHEALDLRLELSKGQKTTPAERSALSIHYVVLGDVAQHRGDLQSCEDYYRNALAIDEQLAADHPDNATYRDNLAWSYDRLGALATAKGDALAAEGLYVKQLDIMQRLVEEDSQNLTRLHGLASSHTRLGEIAGRKGAWLDAADHHGQAVAIGRRILETGSTDSLHWYAQIGRICTYDHAQSTAHPEADRGGMLQEARSLAEQLIAREPDLPRNRHALVLATFRLMMVAANGPDSGAIEERANELLSAIDAYLGFAELTSPIALMRSNGLLCLSRTLRAQNRETEADDCLRRAIASVGRAFEGGVDSTELRIHMAELLREASEVPEGARIRAIDAARKSIEVNPESKPAHIASVGRLYHSVGEFESAVQVLESAERAYRGFGADLPADDARVLRECRSVMGN